MTKTLLYGLSALAVFSSCSKELEEQSTALEIASLQTGLTTTATVSLPAPKDLTKVFIAFKDTSAYFWNPVTRLWVPEIADYSTTGSIPFSASQLAVPTPEALRNRIGVDSGELVRTKGYYSDNDGGATDYHWSPNSREADDGGSVLRPLTITASKAGRWKALFAGKRVSVKQFGAKADYNGSAGTPIRPFVDKAVAYAAGKMTIYFPSGKYYTTSEIKVSGVRNLVLEGQPGATIYKAREGVFDGTECIFKVKDCEGARISGFSLYGHTPGLQYIKDKWGNITPLINAGDGGIYVYDSRDVEIFRNNFYNFGDGAIRAATLILVNGSVATRRVNVHDNFFRNIFQLSTTYTTGSACADYTLQNNVFDSVKGSIKFASRTTGASNIVIRNNTVRNAFHIGFEFANVSNVQLIGNKLEAPDTCASTPVGVVVYPNIISSGTLVHGNMNHFTIRDGYFRGFRKGIRVKNEQVNGVMYNMHYLRVANVDFYNLKGTAFMDAAVHIFSNNSQGPANIRYVTIDSIRVHKGARHGVVAEYFPDPALSDHGLSITNSTFDTLAANAVFVLGQATSRFKGVKVERNTARGISTNGRFFVGQFADGLLLRNNQATMQGGVLDIIEGANPRLEYNTTTSLSGFGYYFHPVTGTATLTGNRIVVQTGTGRTVKYLTTTAGSTATLITNNITGGSGTEYGTGVKVINQ